MPDNNLNETVDNNMLQNLLNSANNNFDVAEEQNIIQQDNIVSPNIHLPEINKGEASPENINANIKANYLKDVPVEWQDLVLAHYKESWGDDMSNLEAFVANWLSNYNEGNINADGRIRDEEGSGVKDLELAKKTWKYLSENGLLGEDEGFDEWIENIQKDPQLKMRTHSYLLNNGLLGEDEGFNEWNNNIFATTEDIYELEEEEETGVIKLDGIEFNIEKHFEDEYAKQRGEGFQNERQTYYEAESDLINNPPELEDGNIDYVKLNEQLEELYKNAPKTIEYREGGSYTPEQLKEDLEWLESMETRGRKVKGGYLTYDNFSPESANKMKTFLMRYGFSPEEVNSFFEPGNEKTLNDAISIARIRAEGGKKIHGGAPMRKNNPFIASHLNENDKILGVQEGDYTNYAYKEAEDYEALEAERQEKLRAYQAGELDLTTKELVDISQIRPGAFDYIKNVQQRFYGMDTLEESDDPIKQREIVEQTYGKLLNRVVVDDPRFNRITNAIGSEVMSEASEKTRQLIKKYSASGEIDQDKQELMQEEFLQWYNDSFKEKLKNNKAATALYQEYGVAGNRLFQELNNEYIRFNYDTWLEDNVLRKVDETIAKKGYQPWYSKWRESAAGVPNSVRSIWNKASIAYQEGMELEGRGEVYKSLEEGLKDGTLRKDMTVGEARLLDPELDAWLKWDGMLSGWSDDDNLQEFYDKRKERYENTVRSMTEDFEALDEIEQISQIFNQYEGNNFSDTVANLFQQAPHMVPTMLGTLGIVSGTITANPGLIGLGKISLGLGSTVMAAQTYGDVFMEGTRRQMQEEYGEGGFTTEEYLEALEQEKYGSQLEPVLAAALVAASEYAAGSIGSEFFGKAASGVVRSTFGRGLLFQGLKNYVAQAAGAGAAWYADAALEGVTEGFQSWMQQGAENAMNTYYEVGDMTDGGFLSPFTENIDMEQIQKEARMGWNMGKLMNIGGVALGALGVSSYANYGARYSEQAYNIVNKYDITPGSKTGPVAEKAFSDIIDEINNDTGLDDVSRRKIIKEVSDIRDAGLKVPKGLDKKLTPDLINLLLRKKYLEEQIKRIDDKTVSEADGSIAQLEEVRNRIKDLVGTAKNIQPDPFIRKMGLDFRFLDDLFGGRKPPPGTAGVTIQDTAAAEVDEALMAETGVQDLTKPNVGPGNYFVQGYDPEYSQQILEGLMPSQLQEFVIPAKENLQTLGLDIRAIEIDQTFDDFLNQQMEENNVGDGGTFPGIDVAEEFGMDRLGNSFEVIKQELQNNENLAPLYYIESANEYADNIARERDLDKIRDRYHEIRAEDYADDVEADTIEDARALSDLAEEYQKGNLDNAGEMFVQYNKVGKAALKRWAAERGITLNLGDPQVNAEVESLLNKEFPSFIKNFDRNKAEASTYMTNIAKRIGPEIAKEGARKGRQVSQDVLTEKGYDPKTEEQKDFDEVAREDTQREKVYSSSTEQVQDLDVARTIGIVKDELQKDILTAANQGKNVADTVSVIRENAKKHWFKELRKDIGTFAAQAYKDFINSIDELFIKSIPAAAIKRRFGKLFGIKKIGTTPTKQVGKSGKMSYFDKPVYSIPKITKEGIQEFKDYFLDNEKRQQSIYTVLVNDFALESIQELMVDKDFMQKLETALADSDITAVEFMESLENLLDLRTKEDTSLDVIYDTADQKLFKGIPVEELQGLDRIDKQLVDISGMVDEGWWDKNDPRYKQHNDLRRRKKKIEKLEFENSADELRAKLEKAKGENKENLEIALEEKFKKLPELVEDAGIDIYTGEQLEKKDDTLGFTKKDKPAPTPALTPKELRQKEDAWLEQQLTGKSPNIPWRLAKKGFKLPIERLKAELDKQRKLGLPIPKSLDKEYRDAEQARRDKLAKEKETKGIEKEVSKIKEAVEETVKTITGSELGNVAIQKKKGPYKKGLTKIKQYKDKTRQSGLRPVEVARAWSVRDLDSKVPGNFTAKDITTAEAKNWIKSNPGKTIEEAKEAIAKERNNETFEQARDRTINKFLEKYPQWRKVIRGASSFGIDRSFFQTTEMFDRAIAKAKRGVKQIISFFKKAYVTKTGKKLIENSLDDIRTKEFKDRQIQGIDDLIDLYKDMSEFIQDNPNDAWVFGEIIADSTDASNGIFRLAATYGFHPILENGKPNLIDSIVAEHTKPNMAQQRPLSKAMMEGPDAVEAQRSIAKATYMQGGFLKFDDDLVNKNYKDSMPEEYYTEVLPALLRGDLDYLVKNYPGIVSWIRPAMSRVNPNFYKSNFSDLTIAEIFGVGVKGDLRWYPDVVAAQNKAIIRILSGENQAQVIKEFKQELKVAEKVDIQALVTQETAHPLLERRCGSPCRVPRTGKQIKETLVNSGKVQANAQKITKKPKGLSAFDLDDTLALTKEKVLYTMPDGTKGELTAGEFAVQYETLLEQGAEFDFSNFENVDLSTPKGPLAGVALKRQAKYGSKDIYVVTARPGAAKQAIKTFLDSIGLNIPIDNIITLEDGSPQAKADWVISKAQEGYNDFYFADDSALNVDTVKQILDQIDVKSKVQQAIADKATRLDKEFNEQIEDVTGKEAFKKYSDVRGRLEGKRKDAGLFKRFLKQFTITPSAEDFMGLMYDLIGKGKQGDKHMKWIKDHLIDPYNKAEQMILSAKVTVANDFAALKESFPSLRSTVKGNPLMQEIGVGPYTKSQAIRVYLWNKQGMEILGMSKRDVNRLVKAVENDFELKQFADNLQIINKLEQYPAPVKNWLAGDITSDILRGLDTDYRTQLMTEFNENIDIIFSEKNKNKLRALYGNKWVEALEDSIRRMKAGSNRPVYVGGGARIVNEMLDWLNSSVGAVMFINVKSGLLQLISNINFINWGDNNIYAAAKAFMSPEYWPTVMKLLNSDYLVNRRDGLKINVNEAELADAGRKGGIKGAINYLLDKGFIITRIMDSLAIATGGATFYINRIKSLLNRINPETGKLYTKAEAEVKAFDDFYAISEESQQSSNPSKISQQQASMAGRVILAFQNVTMQYTRMTKKAIRDLYNRRKIPGLTQRESDLSNISKIVYYTTVQNLIFNALQQAVFALAFDDETDEEEKKRAADILNGMADSLLFGLGFGGAIVSTVKNVLLKVLEEKEKKSPDYEEAVWEIFNISPVLDSKVRKLRTTAKTFSWNMEDIKRRGWSLDNPSYLAIAQLISAFTNIPIDRVMRKTMNMRQAMDEETRTWQRIALVLGYSGWSLGLPYWGLESTIQREAEQIEKVKQQYKIDAKRLKSQGYIRVPLTGPKSGKPKGKLNVDYIQVERPTGVIEYWIIPKK